MKKRNIILIGIIIVAFGIVVFLVTKAISGPEPIALPVSDGTTPAGEGQVVDILPMGNTFDTSSLKKINSQFNVYSYPQVTEEAVGVNISNLIKSPQESLKPGS